MLSTYEPSRTRVFRSSLVRYKLNLLKGLQVYIKLRNLTVVSFLMKPNIYSLKGVLSRAYN